MTTNVQNVQAFKFNYDVNLQKISLAISFPCKIQVTMKRGTQKIESKQFDLENGIVKMDQLLNLQTNLYLDMDNKTFLEKKATFTVLIISPKGQKVAGTCQIDLAHYARNRIPSKQEALKLEKCPDKNAIFTFNINTSMIGQVEFDSISLASVASKAQNEYLSAEDMKKHSNQQSSRTPSQTNLQSGLDPQIKSPNKENTEIKQQLNANTNHIRNNSQIGKDLQKQQENQNNQVLNGQHKDDDKSLKQLEQMKKQLEDYQMEKLTFQKKIEFLQKSLTESEEKKNELLKEKQEYIKQVNQLNEMVRNQSNGDENLKKQCQNYEKQLQDKSKVIEKKDLLIQEQSLQVKKLQDQINSTQSQLTQNIEHMKTIQDLQQQISQLKKVNSQPQEDPKLKIKVEEQQTIILKLQNQLEQIKQETNDVVRARVNEVYTQQQSKIQELETTNTQLRVSITNSEQNDRLSQEKQLLMEELSEKKTQISKLQKDLKNALDQAKTADMLSNELVKSKQKLGDIYNRAMEMGVYEKLLQF